MDGYARARRGSGAAPRPSGRSRCASPSRWPRARARRSARRRRGARASSPARRFRRAPTASCVRRTWRARRDADPRAGRAAPARARARARRGRAQRASACSSRARCSVPPQVGMLASLGRSVVAVRQRPRVAILSGGDELVEPDGDVARRRASSRRTRTRSPRSVASSAPSRSTSASRATIPKISSAASAPASRATCS